MLSELASVDGLDVNLLLQFLGKILKIHAVFTVTDQLLLQLIYPYCKRLSNRVEQALNNSWGFDRCHDDVIFSFIPRRRFDRPRQETFGRLQKEESLSAYSDAIKEAAQSFKIVLMGD
jgi:hypothetical protein